MAIPEFVRSNFIPSIFGTSFGALVTFIATKLVGKTARLRYSTRVERLALAADDPIFGAVRVTWGNGNNMRNLYLATLEIENMSTRDFENVEFKVYCENGTLLLGERTSVLDSPYIVDWSPTFRDSLTVPEGGAVTDAQWHTYYRSREYKLPVLNRGQLLHLNYLCTRPNDDVTPGVFVSTQTKGARLNYQLRSNFMHGVPTQITILHGLAIAFVTVVLCGYFLRDTRIASAICILVGLFAQSLGAGEYKLRRWLWKQLAG